MEGEQVAEVTVSFLPHRLNRQPVVVRGLTADELWICTGLSGSAGLLLGIPLAWLSSSIAMVPTLVVTGIAAGVFIGGSFLRRHKRGKQLHVGQQLEVTATDNISMTSTRGEIHIDSPTALIFSCGGAFIKLANGRIEMGSPEPMLIRAVTQVQAPARFGIPSPPTAGEIEFRLVHPDGTPMGGNAFTATLSDGTQRDGVVDQDGYARLAAVTPGSSAQVRYQDTSTKTEVTTCTETDADLQQLVALPQAPGNPS